MKEKRYRGFDKTDDKDQEFSTMAERSKAQPEYLTDEPRGSIDISGKNPQLNRTNKEIIDTEISQPDKK